MKKLSPLLRIAQSTALLSILPIGEWIQMGQAKMRKIKTKTGLTQASIEGLLNDLSQTKIIEFGTACGSLRVRRMKGGLP